MELYGRQGDLVFSRVERADGELLPASDYVLAGAASGAPHTVRGEVLARREEGRTLVRVTEPTVVEHAGRHQPLELEPGDYEIRPLRERGGEGDRAVED